MYSQIPVIISYLILIIYIIISFIALFLCAFTFDNPNSGGIWTNFHRLALILTPAFCAISAKMLEDNGSWYGPFIIILLNISLVILSFKLLDTFNKGKF